MWARACTEPGNGDFCPALWNVEPSGSPLRVGAAAAVPAAKPRQRGADGLSFVDLLETRDFVLPAPGLTMVSPACRIAARTEGDILSLGVQQRKGNPCQGAGMDAEAIAAAAVLLGHLLPGHRASPSAGTRRNHGDGEANSNKVNSCEER